jgi:hypothetical protein
MIGLKSFCSPRIVCFSSERSSVCWKTFQIQNTRSQSARPCSPNSFSAPRPSACAAKSRFRCAQQS